MTSRRGNKDRVLSEEERALWEQVKRTATPMRKNPLPANDPPSKTHRPAGEKPKAKKKKVPATPVKRVNPPITLPASPSPRRIEQRLVQKVARGRREIDATIDLHGLRQLEAQQVLLTFLTRARAQGCRVVLVITGKGQRGARDDNPYVSPEEPGVLRRAVRHWLDLPDFASLVVGHSPAHQRHGGTGALYVQIRRHKTATG